MTNSKHGKEGEKIVEEIATLLDETRLRNKIEEPIDHALRTFQLSAEEAFSVALFHQEISRFVQHLYKNGMRFEQDLAPPEALSEAIAILEAGYQSEQARGYRAASLDATNPNYNGIYLVICRMAEIIKVQERVKQIQWALASQIDPFDWQTKCRLAEHLMACLGLTCLPNILQCAPAQLAEHWQDLLRLYLEAKNTPLLSFRFNAYPSS